MLFTITNRLILYWYGRLNYLNICLKHCLPYVTIQRSRIFDLNKIIMDITLQHLIL